MPAKLTHFAINADEFDSSREFYESVFGWAFKPYGPPGFFQIQTGTDDDPGTLGAIQERRQLLEDLPTRGFECTFAVDDVNATRQAVLDAGGTVLMERSTISHVGHLIAFEDPSGNPVLAMEYDSDAE
jgi:predicted enzyme related to lactoylglutathione lyase